MCLFYCTTDCGSYNFSCATKSSKKKTSRLSLTTAKQDSALCEKMMAHEKRRGALIRHFHLSFYKGAIAVAALGTYYTFLLVAQPDPFSETRADNKIFTPNSSRTLVAVAWLLFLLSFGLSTAALLCYSFSYASARPTYQDESAEKTGYHTQQSKEIFSTRDEKYMTVTSGIIFGVILVAFLISSLAVTAYMPAIGIIGSVFIAIFMIVSLIMWIRQLVQKGRSRRSSSMMASRRASHLGPDLEAGLWNMMTAGGSVPVAMQQPTHAPTTSHNVTSPDNAGTTGSRASTRKHQPIIIRDPRADSSGSSTP